MLAPDGVDFAAQQAGLWAEDRVKHWWDGAGKISRLFQQSLGLQGPAWDVYLLYRRGVRFDGEAPPAPPFWMHQLRDPAADPDLCLSRDPSRLSRELDSLSEE